MIRAAGTSARRQGRISGMFPESGGKTGRTDFSAGGARRDFFIVSGIVMERMIFQDGKERRS